MCTSTPLVEAAPGWFPPERTPARSTTFRRAIMRLAAGMSFPAPQEPLLLASHSRETLRLDLGFGRSHPRQDLPGLLMLKVPTSMRLVRRLQDNHSPSPERTM